MVRKRGRAYRSSYWDRGNKIWSGLWSIYTFQENIPLFSCYLFSSSNRNGLGRDYAQKLVVNVCINPLTALLGVKNGELITNRFYQMMEQVFQEVAFLIRGEKKWYGKWYEMCVKERS